jgi:hypothetical protein
LHGEQQGYPTRGKLVTAHCGCGYWWARLTHLVKTTRAGPSYPRAPTRIGTSPELPLGHRVHWALIARSVRLPGRQCNPLPAACCVCLR